MKDAELIDVMGGCTMVATLLGFKEPNKSGAARVANWKRRGIPVSVRLENQKLFKMFSKRESRK